MKYLDTIEKEAKDNDNSSFIKIQICDMAKTFYLCLVTV